MVKGCRLWKICSIPIKYEPLAKSNTEQIRKEALEFQAKLKMKSIKKEQKIKMENERKRMHKIIELFYPRIFI